jgi:hypothetical protein
MIDVTCKHSGPCAAKDSAGADTAQRAMDRGQKSLADRDFKAFRASSASPSSYRPVREALARDRATLEPTPEPRWQGARAARAWGRRRPSVRPVGSAGEAPRGPSAGKLCAAYCTHPTSNAHRAPRSSGGSGGTALAPRGGAQLDVRLLRGWAGNERRRSVPAHPVGTPGKKISGTVSGASQRQDFDVSGSGTRARALIEQSSRTAHGRARQLGSASPRVRGGARSEPRRSIQRSQSYPSLDRQRMGIQPNRRPRPSRLPLLHQRQLPPYKLRQHLLRRPKAQRKSRWRAPPLLSTCPRHRRNVIGSSRCRHNVTRSSSQPIASSRKNSNRRGPCCATRCRAVTSAPSSPELRTCSSTTCCEAASVPPRGARTLGQATAPRAPAARSLPRRPRQRSKPMRHSLPRPGLPPRASIVRHAALYSNVTASAAPGWTPTAYAAAAEHGWNSTTSNLRAKAAAPNRITCGCSAELTIASPPSAPRPRAHRAHDETAPEGATPRAWVSDLGAAPEVRDSRGFESVREQVAPVKSQLRVPPPKVDSPCSV